MKIIDALAELDVENDEQWTEDGLPLLEVIRSMVGEEVERQDVTNVAPNFTRHTLDLTPPAAEPEPATAAPPEPVVAVEEEEEEDPYAVDPESEVSQIRARLVEVQREIADTNIYIDKGKQHLAKLQEQEGKLFDLLLEVHGVETTQDHISRYLAQQRRNLERRAESLSGFRERGITAQMIAEAIEMRAPIDQAMQTRGRRPARSV